MLEFAPLREWVAVLREHRIDRRFALRAATSVAMSTATTPLRLYESLRHGRALRATALHPSPVFVVGCARSGTTHLHNLLAQDPQFGFVTNFQAMFQTFALSGSRWLQPLLARFDPPRRPMDNVLLDMAGPQEEDVAIAACSRHSSIHCNTFPRDFDRLFRTYTLGELDADTHRRWEAATLGVLRKATRASGGKRLVLKSPTNTGHIPLLRELFPQARFIHIHRDPYLVFQSIASAARKVLPICQLQEIPWEDLEEHFVRAYQLMMRAFLDDRGAIPAGHLAEVRFDALEAAPLRELERLYAELDLLPGCDFTSVRPHVEAYLERLGSYQKNSHAITRRVIERVNDRWAFAFEAFGYERRDPDTGD